jgi:hypothetical protein
LQSNPRTCYHAPRYVPFKIKKETRMKKPVEYVHVKVIVTYEDDEGETHTSVYNRMAEFVSDILCQIEETIEAVETKNHWTAVKVDIKKE